MSQFGFFCVTEGTAREGAEVGKGGTRARSLNLWKQPWLSSLDADSIYFSKAFDTVPHSTLLEKLAAHGLDGCTLCWIKN